MFTYAIRGLPPGEALLAAPGERINSLYGIYVYIYIYNVYVYIYIYIYIYV